MESNSRFACFSDADRDSKTEIRLLLRCFFWQRHQSHLEFQTSTKSQTSLRFPKIPEFTFKSQRSHYNLKMSRQILPRLSYLNYVTHISSHLCLFSSFRRNIWDKMKHGWKQINTIFRYSNSLSRKVGKVFFEGLIHKCKVLHHNSQQTTSVTFQIQSSLFNPFQVAEQVERRCSIGFCVLQKVPQCLSGERHVLFLSQPHKACRARLSERPSPLPFERVSQLPAAWISF